MEIEEIIIFIFVSFIVITSVILPVLIELKQDAINAYLKTYPPVYNFFNNVILNHITIIIFITLISELLIYITYKEISIQIQRKREIETETEEEWAQLNNFLEVDLKSLDYNSLIELYDKFKYPRFSYISLSEFEKDIELRLFEAKKRLIVLDHKKDVEIELDKKQEAEQKLEEINHEIHLKELKDKEKREKIIDRLSIGYKEVFKRENLNPKEREIAKQEGYHAINEYCVLENKLIPVLVKPTLNHSPTHTFLVWSVAKLLKKFPKIERIIEHDTRDADITFRIKNKIYAIEIEKGSLLRKQRQLKEKIESLDDAYRDNWLILVSNKNLAKKYKKFGNVSTRKDLRKKIEKWIKRDESSKK